MRFLFHIIVIGLIMISYSCNNPNSEILIEINRQINRLKIERLEYANVDSLKIATIRKTIKSNYYKIGDLAKDSIKSIAMPYSHLDKSFKQIIRMDKIIRLDYRKTISQLHDLYIDAEKNIIDGRGLKNYFDEEKRITESIIQRMQFNSQRLESEITKFDSLNTIIVNHLNN